MTNTIFTFITGFCTGSCISIIIAWWLARQSHREWMRITEEMQSKYLKLNRVDRFF